jgi:hypothetical protein
VEQQHPAVGEQPLDMRQFARASPEPRAVQGGDAMRERLSQKSTVSSAQRRSVILRIRDE